MRRALRHGRQDGRRRRRDGRPAHDGTSLRVGRTSEGEIDRIAREGGSRGAIYTGLRALRDRYHTRIDLDLTSAEGIRAYGRFAEDAADLVVRYGGSLSGEHGDGQSRAELLPRMFGPTIVQVARGSCDSTG